MAGVAVPLHASEHFYIVTEPMAGVTPDLPVLRDPDGYIYVREEVGGLLMGGFEPVAKPWGMRGIPADFAFSLLPEDWDHFQVMMEQAIDPHPRDRDGAGAPARQRARELHARRPLSISARRRSAGTSSSPPASTRSASRRAPAPARRVAEWIVGGEAPMDLWDVDIRRVAPFQANPRYLHERTVEMVGRLYAMHWPFSSRRRRAASARAPLHERLAARGACFGEVMGWERANWYAAPGDGAGVSL